METSIQLTLSPPSMTKVPDASSLDLDEMLSNSPRSKLFDTQTTFSPSLRDIEVLWKLKQKRNIAEDNFGGLRVNMMPVPSIIISMPIHAWHTALTNQIALTVLAYYHVDFIWLYCPLLWQNLQQTRWAWFHVKSIPWLYEFHIFSFKMLYRIKVKWL